MTTNGQTKIANGLIGFVVFVLFLSAVTKLIPVELVASKLIASGFTGAWVTVLGLMELGIAGLFASRRTRTVGLLLYSAFLGGAIATHIQHGESPAFPAVILAIGWAGVWLRGQALSLRGAELAL